jgi:hypothetical protein
MGSRGGPSFEAVFGPNYNKNRPGKTAANYAIIGGIVLTVFWTLIFYDP